MHLQGTISAREFVALFDVLVREHPHIDGIRLLFDWSDLGRWALEDWPALGSSTWSPVASRIAKVAIVHPATWRRQAAMVAAILRKENVTVRSWKPDQTGQAIAWLEGTV